MNCNYNLKEYDAIVQQMIDLDREKIIYPITTDNAVIITSLENSPITLTEYLATIKQYTDISLELYDRSIIGETPEGKAYKATDGIQLEENLEELQQNLDNFKDEINSLGLYNYNIRLNNLYNNFTTLQNSVNYLQDIVSNIKYEYEIILFKVTQKSDIPEEPKPVGNGYFSDNWDISYDSSQVENNYVWMATSIITVKNGNISYSPWKVMLLYSNGQYVGESSKYEKSIYYITSEYRQNLAKPTDNYLNEGWANSPTGVSMQQPYEYISTRYYSLDNNPLGEWSTPVLWSRWGSVGRDSSDIEYIYCAINLDNEQENWPFADNDDKSPNSWDPNTVQFQEPEYIKESQTELWYDNPVGLTTQYPYQFVSIRKRYYQRETDSYIWQRYSKPVLWSSLGKDGNATEVQGLMGPVVRFKGLYKDTETYVNMKNDTSLSVNDIRYVDVVKYDDGNYYMVLPEENSTRSVKGKTPPNYPNDWKKAEGFEFIATDVLYAEEGKIDYLASNEVVIFDKDPDGGDANIVAGMTGGNSTLIIDGSANGEGNNPVRIWAGSNAEYQEDGTTINLQETPFRVHEDGKLVAKDAEINGDISASSISLITDTSTNTGMFWYNQNEIILPEFRTDQHKLAYILLYNNESQCTVKTPNDNIKILYYQVDTVSNEKSFEKTSQLDIDDNNLYTLISNYDRTTGQYQWVITQQGVYYTNVSSNNNIIDAPFEIILNNAPENSSKVQVYITRVESVYSSQQHTSRVNIYFKFKLGNRLQYQGVDIDRAEIFSLILLLKLPKTINYTDVLYTLNSNSSFCFNSITRIEDMGESEQESAQNNLDSYSLSIGSKNGNYIYLTEGNATNEYMLSLNLLDTSEQFIIDQQIPINMNNISAEYYLDNEVVKLRKK